MTFDPAVDDLLKAIYEALDGKVGPWQVAAISSAVGRVLGGDDDPGAAADWLREFLAQREGAALAEIARRDGSQADRDLAAGRTMPLPAALAEMEDAEQ